MTCRRTRVPVNLEHPWQVCPHFFPKSGGCILTSMQFSMKVLLFNGQLFLFALRNSYIGGGCLNRNKSEKFPIPPSSILSLIFFTITSAALLLFTSHLTSSKATHPFASSLLLFCHYSSLFLLFSSLCLDSSTSLPAPGKLHLSYLIHRHVNYCLSFL